MRISLQLPASIYAAAPEDDRDTSAKYSHLQVLLSRADRLPDAPLNADASLCALFDPALADDPPVAALSALACGLDSARGYWLRADPVHLQPTRDDLTVWPVTDLDAKDADVLAGSLNAFLRADAMALRVGRPDHWFIELPAAPRLTTWPLSAVAGTVIGTHLPHGADAGPWLARLTELQMLLHDHPCNLRRESEGRAMVNALWLWGGGALPAPPAPPAPPATPATPFDTVYSDGTLARGLALHAGCAVQPVPAHYNGLLPTSHALVTFDPHTNLAALDAQWFAPLRSALRDGRVAAVDILLCGASTSRWRIQRQHLWRFWRRAASAPLPGTAHQAP